MTGQEFADACIAYVGFPYVYGGRGNILTQAYIDTMASMYPEIYTPSYIQQAQQYIGQQCFDCSGLIYYVGGTPNLSSIAQIDYCQPNVGTIDYDNSPPVGALLFRYAGEGSSTNHIGIYIGNGQHIEARGIEYGIEIREWTLANWDVWGLSPDIEYVTIPIPPIGGGTSNILISAYIKKRRRFLR